MSDDIEAGLDQTHPNTLHGQLDGLVEAHARIEFNLGELLSMPSLQGDQEVMLMLDRLGILLGEAAGHTMGMRVILTDMVGVQYLEELDEKRVMDDNHSDWAGA